MLPERDGALRSRLPPPTIIAASTPVFGMQPQDVPLDCIREERIRQIIRRSSGLLQVRARKKP
jgi:hypothetical protein